MKIFIIAAVTLDGFISRNDSEPAMWTSKADKEFFKAATKKAGVIVMGSKTFETIGRALPGRRNIVLSRTKRFDDIPGIESSEESPTELVSRLEQEGVTELAVCGGSHIYTSFMKAGLVDTIYVTVEAIAFGSGITLFNEPIDAKLALRETRSLGDGAVLLEYSVIK